MRVKTIKVQKGGFVNLSDFVGLIDIKRVEYCELINRPNRSVILLFFDKDQKLIKPKKNLTKYKKNKKIKK